MEKIKFETKQEYLDYIKENELYNINHKYNSQYMHINDTDAVLRETWFDTDCYIDKEPKSYPCIFVWVNDSQDYLYGTFVYLKDFS